MKKLLLVGLLCFNNAYATIYPTVESYNSLCQVRSPCQIGSLHSLRIVNDTRTVQTYHWFYSVQAVNGDVINKMGEVTLQPGAEWRQDKIKNIGYMKFNLKGRKILTATTQADGYEHNKAQATGWADVN